MYIKHKIYFSAVHTSPQYLHEAAGARVGGRVGVGEEGVELADGEQKEGGAREREDELGDLYTVYSVQYTVYSVQCTV